MRITQKISALLALAATLLIVSTPLIASAVAVAGSGGATPDDSCSTSAGSDQQITICNPIGKNTTLPDLLVRVFRQARLIITFIIPIIVIWGAFQMMFAGGNPEKFATGRNTIVYCIIGFVIILAAEGIASLVQKLLTG